MPVTTRITTFFRIGNLNLYLPLLLDGWVDPSYILRSFILSHHLMKHSESWSVSIHKNNTTCIFWRFVPDFAGLPLPVSKPVQFFQVSHWQLFRSSLGDLRYGNRSVFSLFFYWWKHGHCFIGWRHNTCSFFWGVGIFGDVGGEICAKICFIFFHEVSEAWGTWRFYYCEMYGKCYVTLSQSPLLQVK